MKIKHCKTFIVCEDKEQDTVLIFIERNQHSLSSIADVLNKSTCTYKGLKYCEIDEVDYYLSVLYIVYLIKKIKEESELQEKHNHIVLL